MIDPEEIREARRDLGRRLAQYRQAAGYNQHRLAPHTLYGRSTIANVEIGRQNVSRDFWQRCDNVLGTDGTLTSGYDQLQGLIQRQRREAAGQPDAISFGLTWASDVVEARCRAIEQWSADVSMASLLDGGARTASHAAVLKWLVGSPDIDVAKASGSRPVTSDDVAAIYAVKRSLTALDDLHGGGVVLPMAVAYLKSEVAPLLQGRYSNRIGRQLFAATALVVVTTGWAAYDAGRHGQARRLMLQALRLSNAADNRLLGGYILTVMSHQALCLGHLADALDLARAARTGVNSGASAPGVVIFAATEARALAASDDKTGCLRLMTLAERALAKVQPDSRPNWLDFVDEAELAGKFGRCFRDLGLHREAEQHLDTSLSLHKSQYPRSRAITRIICATNYVRQGELERACQLGLEALPTIGRLRSQRTKDYLADLNSHFAGHAQESLVRQFREQAGSLLAAASPQPH